MLISVVAARIFVVVCSLLLVALSVAIFALCGRAAQAFHRSRLASMSSAKAISQPDRTATIRRLGVVAAIAGLLFAALVLFVGFAATSS